MNIQRYKEIISCFDSKAYDKDFEIVSVEENGEF